MTSEQELRELVEKWREEAHKESTNENIRAAARCYDHADELEAILDE